MTSPRQRRRQHQLVLYAAVGIVGIGAVALLDNASITLLFIFGITLVGLFFTIENQQRVEDVHILVNSRMSAVISRVEQLTGVLDDAGIDVPDAHPEDAAEIAKAIEVRDRQQENAHDI